MNKVSKAKQLPSPLSAAKTKKASSLLTRMIKDKYLLLLLLPGLAYFIIFKYVPMWGFYWRFKTTRRF